MKFMSPTEYLASLLVGLEEALKSFVAPLVNPLKTPAGGTGRIELGKTAA